jgi:putative methyltransferase (TIGR04325 family)
VGIALRNIIRLITPPVLLQLAKLLRRDNRSFIEWEYVPEGWTYAETHPEIKGWNVQDVLEVYKEKWPRFVAMLQGTGPLGMTHESALTTDEDISSHNAMMAFAYILALAAREKERLTMLDWGGGIGHFFLLSQALLPDVEIEYHCKDVPVLCEHGAQLFPQQKFYPDERCFEREYDLVVASTSMHYTEDWQALLQRLSGATSEYLYIANLPSVLQIPSFVFVQRPYQYGYNTEYLAWCLNQTEFLHTAERAGLNLVREFVYGYQPPIQGAPEQNIYRGYLFGKHAGEYESRD